MSAGEEGKNGAMHWEPAARREWFWLLLLVLFAAALRFYRIGAQSIWLDEASSIHVASGTLSYILGAVARGEGSPPLYYLLLALMLKAGDGETVVRALSAGFALLSIPLVFLFARALAGRGVAFLAALLLSFSPYAIYYAQETRAYALLLTLSLASCYCLLLAVERPRWWRWPVYALVTLAALYTHYFMVFLIIAQGITLLSKARYRATALNPWLCCQLGVVIAFLPWLSSALFQFHWQAGGGGQGWVPPVGIWLLPYTFYLFSLGESAAQLKNLQEIAPNAAWLGLSAVAFGLPLAASMADRQSNRALLRWVWLPLAGAIGLPFLLHQRLHFYQPTYLVGLLPLYLVALAGGIWSLRRRRLLLLIPALILPLSAVSLRNYYFNPLYAREDWRAAARYVESKARAGDIIVFHKSWMQLPFDYYYPGNLPEFPLPDRLLPEASPELQRARRLLTGYATIWLVLAHNKDTGSYYQAVLGRWFEMKDGRVFQTCRPISVYRFIFRPGQKRVSARSTQ